MGSFCLSRQEVDHFVEYGYVHLTNCFDRDFAEQWTAEAFTRLGYDPDDSMDVAKVFRSFANRILAPGQSVRAQSIQCILSVTRRRAARSSRECDLGQRLHHQLLARR